MSNDTRPVGQRALNFIGVALVIIAALILAFGAFKWPDAPIRQAAGGFVGKTGIAHTSEDYELFKLWEKALFVSFPLAFAVNIIAAVARRKRKKESHNS
ncbi:MAG TPA: hypothetical protein VF131_22340 [Blastocatellia bacterium]|nr:hypothetical protein [Blastocatellia bacterium]